MAMHERADQVHGYLETGIDYADKFNSALEKGQGMLHKIPGVGEEEGDEEEGDEGGQAGKGKGKKKKGKHGTGYRSPIDRATHLDGKAHGKGEHGAGHAHDEHGGHVGHPGKHAPKHGEKPESKGSPKKGHPEAKVASTKKPEEALGPCATAVGQLERLVEVTLKQAEEKLKGGNSEMARTIIEHNSGLIHAQYEKMNKLKDEFTTRCPRSTSRGSSTGR